MKTMRNKIFSPALLWEGVKQTKALGICFIIISLIAASIGPLVMMSQMQHMNTMQIEPHTVSLLEFAFPIFITMYIIPSTLVFMLFRFMNKRSSSDFYHSAPFSRTCIYVTYSAVVMVWTAFIALLGTLVMYLGYHLLPNVVAIPTDFIGYTILSSLILALLVMSVFLVAKGISGTVFSNLIIAVLIMFAPRVIMLFFAQSLINYATVIDISGLSLFDLSYNIVFAPFDMYTNADANILTNVSTLVYSLILAAVYYAFGMFLHRIRKSEAAGTSSAFACVQHIVRIALGIIPTLIICYTLTARESVSAFGWLVCILASLLFYCLYELATTKSIRRLVRTIPLYLVVIAFDAVFVFGGWLTGNIIISNVPEVAEIKSVSIYDSGNIMNMENNMFSNYGLKSYYSYLAEETEITDKELITLLQTSLAEDVEMIKTNNLGPFLAQSIYYETYKVSFHLNSGKTLERIVYIDERKYLSNSDIENGDNVLTQYFDKNKDYMETITALPKKNEIASVGSTSGTEDLTSEQLDELWQIFRDEYEGLSFEERASSMSDNYFDQDSCMTFDIKGYHNNKEFTSYYSVLSKSTPNTYRKFVELSNENNRKIYETEIRDKLNSDNDFSIDSFDNFLQDSNNSVYFSLYIDHVAKEYQDVSTDFVSTVYASFPSLKTSYSGTFEEKNIKSIRKIADIIYDASANEFDIDGPHPVCFDISTIKRTYTQHENGYSTSGASDKVAYFYVNLTDERYKEISDILGSFLENSYGEDY